MSTSTRRTGAPLRVLCIVPRGVDGKGGIERLYHYMAQGGHLATHPDLQLRFFTSRGDGGNLGWIVAFPFRTMVFLAWMLFGRIDLVHINLSKDASAYRKLVLFYLARITGKRVVVHFHGGGFDIASGSLSTRIVRHLFAAADRLVLLGEAWRDLVSGTLGLPPERIDVVYNGIPDFAASAAIPRPRAPGLSILFCGEIGQRKGADILVDALGRLGRGPDGPSAPPEWRCTLAGNGDSAPYRQSASAHGILDRVCFLGWTPAERIHALMREADIVVLPSRGEALPLSLIEGACAGAALIGTDVGATREIVEDGRNGLIVRPDAEDLARALSQLAADPELRQSMQRASRALYVERFRLERMVARLVGIYRELAPSAEPHDKPQRQPA